LSSSDISPERGFKVTAVLADSAQVADGKLYVLGGGWTMTGPPAPFAIGGIVEVPWHRANEQHEFRLELIDIDGHPFEVETPDGIEPLVIPHPIEVGRPPGIRAGTYLSWPFAFNSAPLPLAPATHYEWRISINGETHEDWTLAFSTRPFQSNAA